MDTIQQSPADALEPLHVADLFGEAEPTSAGVTPDVSTNQELISRGHSVYPSAGQETDDRTTFTRVGQDRGPTETTTQVLDESQCTPPVQLIMESPARLSRRRRRPPRWLADYCATAVKRARHLSIIAVQ